MAEPNDWVEEKPTQSAARSPEDKLKSILQGAKEMGYFDPEKQTQAVNNGVAMMIPSSGVGELIGSKLPKLAGLASAVAPVLEDGAVAAAQSPGNRGDAFVKGAGTSAAMRGTSAILGKAGDYLAQKAAGIRDTKPGRGDLLMDQGVFGTKGMQQAQVAKKIGQRGEELASTVASIKDPLSALNTVQALSDAAEKLKINGVVPSNQTALYKQYTDLADSLKSMTHGESMAIGAPEYQRFKQAQGEVAYNANGKMPDTNVAAAAGLANREASNDIAGAFADRAPGTPNPYREKNAALAALLGAKRGLESKTSLSDLAAIAALGSAGYAADGPKGALAAALLKAPISKSIGAYGARGGSKALGALAAPISRTVVPTSHQPDDWQPDDWVEEKPKTPGPAR